MNVLRHFSTGFVSVLKIIGAPMLYRYRYRTSAEALRSDWMNIGKDIDSVMGQIKMELQDERRAKK